MSWTIGLISLGNELSDVDWKVTPFPPGCYESYSVGDDGRVALKAQQRYYEIGSSKPTFKTSVAWEGEEIKESLGNKICLLNLIAVQHLFQTFQMKCLKATSEPYSQPPSKSDWCPRDE